MTYKLLLLLSLLATSCSSVKTFYVERENSSENASMKRHKTAFSNLDEALTAIREQRIKGDRSPVKIEMAPGNYYFEKGYLLDSLMSDLSIVAQDKGKVVFTGGISLPTTHITRQLLQGREVKCVDLRNLNIHNYGEIRNVGFSRPFYNSWAELFVNNKPMILSRWPNEGMIKMGKILDTGSVPRNNDFSNRGAVMTYDSLRISRWQNSNDIWMSGYFNVGYADDALRIKKIDREHQTITTDGPTLYGFKSQSAWNKWYAFNVKEETDCPGEYYLERTTGKLYFLSPEEQIETLNLSMLEEPFFDIRGAHDIHLDGITFEYSRAAMISSCESNHIKISRCTFRNAGSLAIIIGKGIEAFKDYRHEGSGNPVYGTVGSLQQHLYSNQTFNRMGGKDNVIDHCQFYHLGAGAISLGGGNRMSLDKGNNTVSNCLFHDNNRIAKSYRPAIHVTGVGNNIVNCEIYNTPSMAILMNGNNHVIKNNYIHDVCLEIEDQGAFYYGRNPSECGTVLENNLFANIPSIYSTCAVYHDDGAGGLHVKNNIFYAAGKYSVIMGGGSDNCYEGNIFINGEQAVHVDNRLQNWAKGIMKKDGLYQKRLFEINYKSSPYKEAYPFMEKYWPNNGVPQRNLFRNNIFVHIKKMADNPQFIKWTDNLSDDNPLNINTTDKNGIMMKLQERGYRKNKDHTPIGIMGNL